MEELPRYDATIFVAHSMGGLATLHALLELERSDSELVSKKRLSIMSLGTPYYGAEMASFFGLVCSNPQGEEMQVLKKESGRLVAGWLQMFKRTEPGADKRTAQISVRPFFGLKDTLVQQASACGIDPAACESLDGDHASIAKPLDRTHLTYKKLKSIKDKAEIKTIPPSSSITEPRMLDNAATLIKTCDQSRAKLKRPLGIFVPQWLSTLDRLRSDGWTPDLETLFRLWGGGRCFSGSTCQDQFEEATFTLKCLESSGLVKLENLKSNSLYHGVSFENQRIVFENR
jgi:hypothetical protein